MAETETKSKRDTTAKDRDAVWFPEPAARDSAQVPEPAARDAPGRRRVRTAPILITLATLALAAALGWAMWDAYMGAPWTRDGTVRAYVVTMASEVAGRIVELPVADNQFVHKGDLLMVIDPRDFRIAVQLAEAAVQQAEANAQNAAREAKRREEVGGAVSIEDRQTAETNAVAAQAQLQQAQADLAQARVNLERTQIRSPVNGWVTNLLARLGDYANVGENEISLVDADSFWVDGYFEETNVAPIQVGDPATIKLMGYSQVVRGHVGSIARGINVANAQPNEQGVATVNPIFTWVRLAQRIPVRIEIDQVPEGVTLVAGMTATVQIDPRARQPAR
jgi:RND family efflux transporter MFP subunit